MSKKKIEIYKDKSEEFRARLRSGNNEIVATSEGYTRKTGAENWAKKVAKWGNGAKVKDLTKNK